MFRLGLLSAPLGRAHPAPFVPLGHRTASAAAPTTVLSGPVRAAASLRNVMRADDIKGKLSSKRRSLQPQGSSRTEPQVR